MTLVLGILVGVESALRADPKRLDRAADYTPNLYRALLLVVANHSALSLLIPGKGVAQLPYVLYDGRIKRRYSKL